MGAWIEDVVEAWGHPNVRALHRSTFEITRDSFLTPRGDCIIGVNASKAARHLSRELREALRREASIVHIILETPGEREEVHAQGSPGITALDERRIIVRRSTYVEPATLAIRSDKAARDLSRRLVEELREGARLTVVIRVAAP